MKKGIVVSIAGALLIALGGMVFADGFDTPVEIYADLNGTTVEEAYEERGTDKTFGQLAEEKGFLEEFQKANLESKKAILQERVEEGIITQEEADEIIKAIGEADCTLEPGTNRWGQKYNIGFGRGNNGGQGQGKGYGRGRGQGRGRGAGNGQGFGRRNGNCIYTESTDGN